MVLLKKITFLLIKSLLLLLLITFEKVIGFPVFFVTAAVIFIVTARSASKYALVIISGWLLATIYQLSITPSILLFIIFYYWFVYGTGLIESNYSRFLSLLLVSVIYIFLLTQLVITGVIIAYLCVSLVVSSLIIIKFFLTQYGFLGTRLVTRYSFFK